MTLSRLAHCWHLTLLLICLSGLVSGCAGFRESMDSTWRTVDPAGHHRYHKDKYYPHERKIGISLPGDAGR